MKSYKDFLLERVNSPKGALRKQKQQAQNANNAREKAAASNIKSERQRADAAGKDVAAKAVADKKLRDAKANTPGKKSAVLNKPSNFTPNNNTKPQRVQGNIVGKGGQMELPLGVKSKPKTPAKPSKFKAGKQLPLDFKAAEKGKELVDKKNSSTQKPGTSEPTTPNRFSKMAKSTAKGALNATGKAFNRTLRKRAPSVEGGNNEVQKSMHSNTSIS